MVTVLATIFVLGVLIFVHELGHFIVAKRLGIRVEKFSLGFPPKMVGKRIGETEYLISWIPLGGYVRLAGDNPDEPHTGSRWEFLSRPRWQRSLVIIAGPLMNYLFAIFLVWSILIGGGIGTFQPVIGQVELGSLGQKLGLETGDRVLSAGGRKVSTWDDILDGLRRNEGLMTTMVVERDGRQEVIKDVPKMSAEDLESLGITPLFTTRVGMVEKGGPAHMAGLKEGDVIEAIDGVAVERWSEMVQLIQSKPDSVISIRWRRNGEVRQAQVRTRAVKVPDEEGHLRPVGFVGIASEIVCKRIGPLSAAKESVRWVLENTLQIVQFIKGLATGSVSVRMVGGPIFIAQVAGQTARQGLPTLLSFMALLSVNLALLNILPIPLLDGGQLLIMAIESIKGQPLSQRQRMVIQQLGLVLIIMLIAVVFFNDVTR